MGRFKGISSIKKSEGINNIQHKEPNCKEQVNNINKLHCF